MMLIEETTVPLAALPVARFKDHLRLGTGFGEESLQDNVLESYLRAAIAAIEARTGRILIEREFTWSLTFWRDPGAQVLPVSPVSAIVELALVDRGGAEEIVPPGEYRLEPDALRPRLVATSGRLPGIPADGFAQFGFLAGFGPDFEDLPADLAHAVLVLAAHYYEYRHEVGLAGGALPYSVNALVDRYRPLRLTAGGRG